MRKRFMEWICGVFEHSWRTVYSHPASGKRAAMAQQKCVRCGKTRWVKIGQPLKKPRKRNQGK